jgi:hypothetical protein
MTDIKCLLEKAALSAAPELSSPISDSTNIIESCDSFSVVNIIIETETMLEAQLGHYISLADETLFDVSSSPMKKWSLWCSYVEDCISKKS